MKLILLAKKDPSNRTFAAEEIMNGVIHYAKIIDTIEQKIRNFMNKLYVESVYLPRK